MRSYPIQDLLITTLLFNLLEQNGVTKTKLYLSTVGWKVNVTRRLDDKMDYSLKEMNDTMTKAEVLRDWVMVSRWNLSVMKSMTEQKDNQNSNLQSIFSLGHQWCWSSKATCLTYAQIINPAWSELTLVDFSFDEFQYYPLIISLGRCDGSCNTIEDQSSHNYKKRTCHFLWLWLVEYVFSIKQKMQIWTYSLW